MTVGGVSSLTLHGWYCDPLLRIIGSDGWDWLFNNTRNFIEIRHSLLPPCLHIQMTLLSTTFRKNSTITGSNYNARRQSFPRIGVNSGSLADLRLHNLVLSGSKWLPPIFVGVLSVPVLEAVRNHIMWVAKIWKGLQNQQCKKTKLLLAL